MKRILLIAFLFTGTLAFAAPVNYRKILKNNFLNWNQARRVALIAFRKTNQFRRNQGLQPLKWRQDQFRVAMQHARRMANGKAQFSHVNFSKRIDRFRIKPKLTGENLYFVYHSKPINVAQWAVQGWKKSPGHRQNLVRKEFNSGAIGVARNSKGYWYLTQFLSYIK